MRLVTAEWRGVDIGELTTEVSWGLPEWGLRDDEYERLHHFAATQRELFSELLPIEGAAQSLRRLSDDIRIRVITHRLLIPNFHQQAVRQTVAWLDRHGVPYWDLCFMQEKGDVGADLYIEDSPGNIKKLREADLPVITFTNSTNRDLANEPGGRADNWDQAEHLIRSRYHTWFARQLAKAESPTENC
jgi:uncharacterized HAD superfamily protein